MRLTPTLRPGQLERRAVSVVTALLRRCGPSVQPIALALGREAARDAVWHRVAAWHGITVEVCGSGVRGRVPRGPRHHGARGPRMTAALRARLRAAVLALPVAQREVHLQALSGLLHLLEHCTEGRVPDAFVAGRRAYAVPALQWAAALLERPWRACAASDCEDPDHVTLTSTSLTAEEDDG
jgi:hypothetical protein